MNQNVNISQEKIDWYEKKLYDYENLIEISKSLCSNLEYNNLIESILYTCMAQMRTLGAGMFILKNFDSDYFTLDNNYSGLDPVSKIDYSINTKSSLCLFLAEEDKAFTLSELESSLNKKSRLKQISSLNPSLIVPLKVQNHMKGILLLGDRIMLDEDSASYTDDERKQILNIASLAAIAINNTMLIEQTTTDMMTHLKLKHYFFTILTLKMDFSLQNDLPLSVLMMDIDHFKNFNDTYGHACGDFVLQKIAKAISDNVRGQDMACRYGGEEFVVMLYDTNAKGAVEVGERIRKAIQNNTYSYNDQELHVTISVGVSTLDKAKPCSPKELVEIADKALYVSKESGRNRVTLADESK